MIQVTDTTEAALFRQKAAAMNQELLIAAVRQHELMEAAEELNAGLQREITERKRAEKALRDSEGRLRALSSQLMNAQETERMRIAHELHDSLVSQLAAIKYRLESWLSQPESPANPAKLEVIIQDVQSAIVETRRIMANLHPSVLDDLGIVPALSWFSREMEKSYQGTSVSLPGALRNERFQLS